MANLAAKHHHGERHARSHEIPQPVDLYHVPISVDHYRVIPKKESREVFDSEGRLAEAYEVKKKIQEGELRLERHTGAGVQAGSVRAPPKKGGKGGKFTWEGQYHIDEQDQAPPAMDVYDPNYDETKPKPQARKRRPRKRGERGRAAPPREAEQEGAAKEEEIVAQTEVVPPEQPGSGPAQPPPEAKEPAEAAGAEDRALSEQEVDQMVHGLDINEYLTRAVDEMHLAGDRARELLARASAGEESGATERPLPGDAGQEAELTLPEISEILIPEPGKYIPPEPGRK